MKRIGIAMLLFGCLFLLWQVVPQKTTEPAAENRTPTASPEIVPSPIIPPDAVLFDTVSVGNGQYTIFGREITRGTEVALLPNFIQKKAAQTLAQEHHCHTAINGGFYTKEGLPLGWFISQGSQSGTRISSSLVSGFFWQDKQGKRYISRTAPSEEEVDFVLQTGPYIEVGEQPLQMVTDEQARRSLLGVDDNNKLYILSVVEKNNTFSGPNLADIPILFHSAAIQEKIPFRTLLNLDGGTASFFYFAGDNQSFILSELTPVGSVLCVQR